MAVPSIPGVNPPSNDADADQRLLYDAALKGDNFGDAVADIMGVLSGASVSEADREYAANLIKALFKKNGVTDFSNTYLSAGALASLGLRADATLTTNGGQVDYNRFQQPIVIATLDADGNQKISVDEYINFLVMVGDKTGETAGPSYLGTNVNLISDGKRSAMQEGLRDTSADGLTLTDGEGATTLRLFKATSQDGPHGIVPPNTLPLPNTWSPKDPQRKLYDAAGTANFADAYHNVLNLLADPSLSAKDRAYGESLLASLLSKHNLVESDGTVNASNLAKLGLSVDSTLSDGTKLDANGDGVVTAQELTVFVAHGVEKNLKLNGSDKTLKETISQALASPASSPGGQADPGKDPELAGSAEVQRDRAKALDALDEALRLLAAGDFWGAAAKLFKGLGFMANGGLIELTSQTKSLQKRMDDMTWLQSFVIQGGNSDNYKIGNVPKDESNERYRAYREFINYLNDNGITTTGSTKGWENVFNQGTMNSADYARFLDGYSRFKSVYVNMSMDDLTAQVQTVTGQKTAAQQALAKVVEAFYNTQKYFIEGFPTR